MLRHKWLGVFKSPGYRLDEPLITSHYIPQFCIIDANALRRNSWRSGAPDRFRLQT